MGIPLRRGAPAGGGTAGRVTARTLRQGARLCFDQEGKKRSHVRMDLGDGRFIHAPSSGGKVRTDSLDAAFWKKHFVEARRI